MRGFSFFAFVTTLGWYDFVSNVAFAASQEFPTLSLFVLMWVFIGVQVVPYFLFVFCLHPPRGCQRLAAALPYD